MSFEDKDTSNIIVALDYNTERDALLMAVDQDWYWWGPADFSKTRVWTAGD